MIYPVPPAFFWATIFWHDYRGDRGVMGETRKRLTGASKEGEGGGGEEGG